MPDGLHVAAALHLCGPEETHLYWTKIALADLPNDLVGIEDLKRFGIAIDRVEVSPVSKAPSALAVEGSIR